MASRDSELAQVSGDDFETQTARSIQIERFRILFSPNGFSCRKFCNARVSRKVSGRPVFIVLAMFFFERLAFYGTIGYAFSTTNSISFAQTVAFNLISELMYPVAGWLADYKFGRHTMMLAGLVLLFVGYAAFSFTVSFYFFWPFTGPTIQKYGILYICVVVISMGAAGFESNAIPFGADQIMFGTSEQLSSYFHWYYWVRNLALIFALVPSIFQLNPGIVLAVSFASVVSVSFALVTDSFCRSKLFIEPVQKNPLKLVANVVWFAATAKRPQKISAFGYDGRERPSRFDLAKAKHGGAYSVDEVEEVKTVLRLIPVLLAIGGVYHVFTGSISALPYQANVMRGSLPDLTNRSLQWYWFGNALTIVAFIPSLDQLVFPCLRDRAPSMLKRIGLSLVILFISVCILVAFEEAGALNPASSGNSSFSHTTNATANVSCTLVANVPQPRIDLDYKLVIIPLALISIAEVLLRVSGLEFFYAQSPHHMRGMAIGFFFFVDGLFGTLAAVIMSSFSRADLLHCGRWYYMTELLLAGVVFVLFVCTTLWYKYRKRTGLEDSGQFYLL